MKILVTGASGLVGSELVPKLKEIGHQVFKLSRKTAENPDEISWKGGDGFDDDQVEKLEGIDVVVHLAGESISDGSWNDEKKNRIRDSRVLGTRALINALGELKNSPRVFISASAVGFYGNREDESLTEESEAGDGFLADVCKAWESESKRAKDFGARVAIARIGIVLSGKGGAISKMRTPFSFGLGGVVGGGKQYMSWIGIVDLVNLLIFLINNDGIEGVINATAPNPVTNKEFTKTLGKVLNRPTFIPVPEFGIKLIFGEMGKALLLEGARVLPAKLEKARFSFEHPHLEEALKNVIA